LEGTLAAGQVSNADLIALAGAKAVAVCGGPSIRVLVGREDAAAADPTGRMVSEKAGVEALKANFADKGLGVKEMVVLSGAHTLGAQPEARLATLWHVM
jgi:L-ascorbate peroxidase